MRILFPSLPFDRMRHLRPRPHPLAWSIPQLRQLCDEIGIDVQLSVKMPAK
jgi:hypothetical protein